MTLLVEISQDEDFDPRNPLCDESIVSDFDDGELYSYNVDLVQIHRCSFEGCKDHHSETLASFGAVLLDGCSWDGTYGLTEVNAWPPDPDVSRIRKLVNQMMAAEAA